MTTKPPSAAFALGAAGLIPFAAGAVGSRISRGATLELAPGGLPLYGGLILSYVGGCRWGFRAAGLGDGDDGRAYAIAVAPALWAFGVLLFAPTLGFAATAGLLALGFVLLYVSDLIATGAGAAPSWWPALRLPLTLGATLSLGGPALAALF